MRTLAAMALLVTVVIMGPSAAHQKNYTVTVSAPHRDYREVPVRAIVDVPAGFGGVALMKDGVPVPCQARKTGLGTEVCWIARDLQKGQSVRYHLAMERSGRPSPASGVIIDRSGGNLDVRIDNQLVTTYNTTTGPNKPYFYPIFAPGQKRLTRGYPLETLPDAVSHDHPHHRGLWFTHGAVNGEDYWSEGGKAARTVHRGYQEVASGPVLGYFRAATDWITSAGAKAAEDVREVSVYNTATGRLMDFNVTVTAVGGPLEFQDTKEGSLGIRVPDSMRAAGGDGHIVMSTGLVEPVEQNGKPQTGGTWGKRADWVDYYGSSQGAVVGIAILDHPRNLRHPTYWHVRDYGLFAANPFGIHDFVKGEPAGAGNFTLAAGKSQSFRYRLYFHQGSAGEAHVEDVWQAYADPPEVVVR